MSATGLYIDIRVAVFIKIGTEFFVLIIQEIRIPYGYIVKFQSVGKLLRNLRIEVIINASFPVFRVPDLHSQTYSHTAWIYGKNGNLP